MKKPIIGCLVLFLLGAIGAGFAGYHFLYRPARGYVESFAKFKVLPELDKQVANTSSFMPPSSGEIDRAELDRFIRTQKAVYAGLGTRVGELGEKYKSLEKFGTAGADAPPVSEVFSALKDLAGLVVEAKRAQVAALNENNFSLAEYEWVRRQIYEAAGIAIDERLQRVIKEAAAGKIPDLDLATPDARVRVPEKNKELVLSHREELLKHSALAFFGL